jgi:hypothetical protein
MVDNAANPFPAAKASKSKACSPIATAGRGLDFEEVEIIPNGILAREK